VGYGVPLLRRQNGGKCQEGESQVSAGITAKRFYPYFENKILATLGKRRWFYCSYMEVFSAAVSKPQ